MGFIRRTIVEIFDSYPPPPKFCSREEDRDVGQLENFYYPDSETIRLGNEWRVIRELMESLICGDLF